MCGLQEWSIGHVIQSLVCFIGVGQGLLSTLNERCFKNGSQMLKDLPLSTAVVASNEVPLEAGAGALMDRFLMRVLVDYATRPRAVTCENSARASTLGNAIS